ncbi:uncharacterized protein CELE_Y65A5A.24 [Caenorhabditis elegans]|uniref:Uncharacterized protein n=1 Tax=Caenorhabditis elegans TaxID=6239 RepID=C1P661_CAEEL|nr:Uncharacterized protein CELE_Y65A5A.24 [Caenorhabditis elegans]CAX65093.1 Uncharacterized protein CELE_Y65A5A.24 [Caenorhabditis elegans]|eukprot:NP_001255888.1 Uncharacterized protein CELE_Y65A5A.24 [Caenorhabditis elegans]
MPECFDSVLRTFIKNSKQSEIFFCLKFLPNCL